MKMKSVLVATLLVGAFALGACSPKVGSDKWCKNLTNKDKGDWTASEAADYMKHCALK
jgi:hypothetical protein